VSQTKPIPDAETYSDVIGSNFELHVRYEIIVLYYLTSTTEYVQCCTVLADWQTGKDMQYSTVPVQ